METDSLRYDKWVEEALRDVIRRALEQAATQGLPGEHHFFVTFQTDDDGVEMPPSLRAEHPKEMTIVLQHQFDDLIVKPDHFALTLSFSGQPTRLVIPFGSVTSFADPSVNFGLQLKMMPSEEGEIPETADNVSLETANSSPPASDAEPPEPAGDQPEDGDEAEKMGEVIALDAFRKK